MKMAKLIIEFIQVKYKDGEVKTSNILIDANEIAAVGYEEYGTNNSVNQLGTIVTLKNGSIFSLANRYSAVRSVLGRYGIESLTCDHPYECKDTETQGEKNMRMFLSDGYDPCN